MLEEYLRHFIITNKKDWVSLLDVAQFCFNLQKTSSKNKSLSSSQANNLWLHT